MYIFTSLFLTEESFWQMTWGLAWDCYFDFLLQNKCYQYWPDEQGTSSTIELANGQMRIDCTAVENSGEFKTRVLQLTRYGWKVQLQWTIMGLLLEGPFITCSLPPAYLGEAAWPELSIFTHLWAFYLSVNLTIYLYIYLWTLFSAQPQFSQLKTFNLRSYDCYRLIWNRFAYNQMIWNAIKWSDIIFDLK